MDPSNFEQVGRAPYVGRDDRTGPVSSHHGAREGRAVDDGVETVRRSKLVQSMRVGDVALNDLATCHLTTRVVDRNKKAAGSLKPPGDCPADEALRTRQQDS